MRTKMPFQPLYKVTKVEVLPAFQHFGLTRQPRIRRMDSELFSKLESLIVGIAVCSFGRGEFELVSGFGLGHLDSTGGKLDDRVC